MALSAGKALITKPKEACFAWGHVEREDRTVRDVLARKEILHRTGDTCVEGHLAALLICHR